MNLLFEWDEHKSAVNQKKHKISFDEARTIFGDPALITWHDTFHSLSEDRYISVGYSSRGRILLVVHTENTIDNTLLCIRIISCRKATKRERNEYEKEKRQSG